MTAKKIISLFLLPILALLGGCSGAGVLNALSSGGGTEIAENVVYDETFNGRLDVYTPRDNPKQAPTVVFLYGGRWTGGDKSDFEFVGKALASRGFVTIIPNLRKFPDVRFPTFVQDAASAVKWARGSANRYGGDGQNLFVMGHSSGAHIAAMLAMDGQYLAAVGGSRAWISGMIGLAGPYDFLPLTSPDLRDMFGPPEQFERSQPIFFADGQNPPMLLMHGENDQVVWVKNTRSLAAAIKKGGGAVETIIYPELSHERILGSIGPLVRGSYDVLANLVEFITRISNGKPPQPEQSGVQGTPLQDETVMPLGQQLPPDGPPQTMPIPVQ